MYGDVQRCPEKCRCFFGLSPAAPKKRVSSRTRFVPAFKIDNLGVSLALVKGGQLRLLGVGTRKRMAALPEVPTIAETLPGFASSAWFAVVAPPKTPRAIVDKVSADIAAAIRSPEVARRFEELSAEPVGSNPDASARFMREESLYWGSLIRAAGVKLD
jgi:tripartite-type tricarboxylate transporter receptor subunit TctC